jgi:hypothetical protein
MSAKIIKKSDCFSVLKTSRDAACADACETFDALKIHAQMDKVRTWFSLERVNQLFKNFLRTLSSQLRHPMHLGSALERPFSFNFAYKGVILALGSLCTIESVA